MKYFLQIVFVVWLVVTYAIFAPNAETEAAKEQIKQSGKTEVVFWHAMGGELGKVMNKMISEYNAQSSKYYIKAVNMGGYDNLAKKILASLIAEEAPDISQNYETLTKKFIKHKKIVCIDELIAKDIASGAEDIRKDIIPVLLRNNTYNGKLYSFPFNKSIQAIYYNKEIFRKVGLDPQKPPQSFQELREYCQKIEDFYKETEGEDQSVYGYGCTKSNNWSFLNRIKANRGFIVKRDNNGVLKCGFNTPAALEAITFLQNMVKDGLAKEGQAFDHQNDFVSQKAAIIEASVISKVFMEGKIRFEYGIAPALGSRNEDGSVYKSTILSGSNINIFNNGDQDKIAGAWDFVKWFTSTENSAKWSIATTYMPVRISSVNSVEIQNAIAKDPNLNAIYDSLDHLTFEPRLTAWFEIRDMIADYLERATLEMGDPRKYCIEMERDVNLILKHVLDDDDNLG